MAKRNEFVFTSCEDLEAKYLQGRFDCDDISSFTDPMVLDWCERVDDWAPKIALCFNPNTSPVTLDRLSQHEMPEIRRLVCFHRHTSMQTLERLCSDGDRQCRESAHEYLEQWAGKKSKKPPVKKTARVGW